MTPCSSSPNAPCTREAHASDAHASDAPATAANPFPATPQPPGAPCTCAEGAMTACPQLARLKAEVARYACAVDRARDLVRALRAASEGNGVEPAPELYWPHLLEVVEGVLPGE